MENTIQEYSCLKKKYSCGLKYSNLLKLKFINFFSLSKFHKHYNYRLYGVALNNILKLKYIYTGIRHVERTTTFKRNGDGGFTP